MANKFKLWVEDANINATQTYNDFDSDTQRAGGFVGGTPASAIRVNTALRQANLIACALMDVVAPDNASADFRSSRAEVKNAITEGLKTIKVNEASNADTVNSFTVTKDSNDVLRIGEIIVPYKKLIYSGQHSSSDIMNNVIIVPLPEGISLKTNKHYIIEGFINRNAVANKAIFSIDYYCGTVSNYAYSSNVVFISISDSNTNLKNCLMYVVSGMSGTSTTEIHFNFTTLSDNFNLWSGSNLTIQKIYEVVE